MNTKGLRRLIENFGKMIGDFKITMENVKEGISVSKDAYRDIAAECKKIGDRNLGPDDIETLEAIAEKIDALMDNIGDMLGDLSEMQDGLSKLVGQLTSLKGEVRDPLTPREHYEEYLDILADIQDELAALQEMIGETQEDFGALQGDLGHTQGRLINLISELEEIEEEE